MADQQKLRALKIFFFFSFYTRFTFSFMVAIMAAVVFCFAFYCFNVQKFQNIFASGQSSKTSLNCKCFILCNVAILLSCICVIVCVCVCRQHLMCNKYIYIYIYLSIFVSAWLSICLSVCLLARFDSIACLCVFVFELLKFSACCALSPSLPHSISQSLSVSE